MAHEAKHKGPKEIKVKITHFKFAFMCELVGRGQHIQMETDQGFDARPRLGNS